MESRVHGVLAVAACLALVGTGASLSTTAPPAGPAPSADGGSSIIDRGCTATIPTGATSGSCETEFSMDQEPSFTGIILVHALAGTEATVDVSWFSGGQLYYRLHCTHVAGTGFPFFHRHVALRTPAPEEHPDGSPLKQAPSTCSVSGDKTVWSGGTQRVTVETQIPLHATCQHPFRDCGIHGGFDLD